MSTYFPTKLKYITEEMKSENFDFKPIYEELKKLLSEEKGTHFWDKLQQLKVRFQITSPDFTIIDKFYDESKIKSHEIVPITEKLSDMVKNALNISVNTINYSINKYIPFKHSISLNKSESVKSHIGKRTQRIDIVEFNFYTQQISLKESLAFLKWFEFAEFSFSESIKVDITGESKKISSIHNILSSQIEKKSLSSVRSFLSTEDINPAYQLLAHPHYFTLLKKYMFPEGFQANAEITLDIAKEGLIAQKRRKVSMDGPKLKFHQLLTATTPLDQYQKIIKENDIVGIYISVRSTNDDLLYILIDIDVPSILFSLFPAQEVWTLTRNISKSINKIASRLGLPSFKISFSGEKGIHMTLKLQNSEVITDDEQYVNIPELYNYILLPGITAMKKERVSSLNDKFKFMKTLLSSLLLHTIYYGQVKIPDLIKYGLQISHPYQLFRLSPDAQNRISILLDCSSMSKGVYRLFSPHLTSKLVSIPLSSEKFLDRYQDYTNVREDAKLSNVIDRFNSDDVEAFMRMPNVITRRHIKELLRPDRLLPTFAVLLRFGTIYSITRSPQSFKFWHRFYEIRSFYRFIETEAFNYNRHDFDNFYVYINNMANRLNIENKDCIMDTLTHYLQEKKISYPVFKSVLSTLYYIEFFFNLKSDIFFRDNIENLLELFKNEMEFNNFLNQAQEIFSIAVDTVFRHLTFDTEAHLTKTQKKSMDTLYDEINMLIDTSRKYLGNLKHDIDLDDKEEQLIKTIFFISRLYFASLVFVRSFHGLLEKSRVIKKWR